MNQNQFDQHWGYNQIYFEFGEFIQILKNYDLDILKNTFFNKIYNVTEKLVNKSEIEDYLTIIPQMVGFASFVKKILKVKDHLSFVKLRKHFELLCNENTSIIQNQKSLSTDQDTNKIFELVIASSIMRFSKNVDVDDPKKSTGNNPDIKFEFRGKKWGIACKVLHSQKIETYMDRFEEGVSQIEKSDVNKGFVVFNYKNILPHDMMLNPTSSKNEDLFESYDSKDIPIEILKEFCINKIQLLTVGFEKSAFKEILANKKAQPFIANYVFSACITKNNNEIAPTRIEFLTGMPIYCGLDIEDDVLLLMIMINIYTQVFNAT